MRSAAVLLVVILLPAGCVGRSSAPVTIDAIASFYPLFEFTQHVGGERLTVRNLVPAGAEPHDYEPTPRDLVALKQAELLVYNGAGFEPWIKKLLPELPASAVKVEATKGLPLMKGLPEHDDGAERESEEAHEDQQGLDPHVWLDPLLAARQVDNILAGIVKADPAGRTAYQAKAARVKEGLEGLHAQFQATLATCRLRTFITSHAAFGYLARRYRLRMISISGITPEAEPTPTKLKEIVRQARRYGIRVIYYETLVDPRVAATIAREVGARTMVLNPLEGLTAVEQRAGKSYVSVMEENLRNLAIGLECR